MQPVLDVYSVIVELATCGCEGQRTQSRNGPILSVSLIISVIVAFTGRVLWVSAIVVISRHGRENQRTFCNFSIWTVADVGICKKAVLWQRETGRCRWKLRYVPKFTAALCGSLSDSTALVSGGLLKMHIFCQIAYRPFKVIQAFQGHWFWYQSKARNIRLPIITISPSQ